jgi:hypothetical protein
MGPASPADRDRPDGVDGWLSEHEAPPGGAGWRVPTVPLESILGGVFLVWGVLLLVVLIFDLIGGAFLFLVLPWSRPWWVASVGLDALGAWLAFELSEGVGFAVSEERTPEPDPVNRELGEPRKT